MPKFFVAGNQINNNKITIIGNDVNHIKNVLRQKSGDKITICDISKEQDYLCKIDKIEERLVKEIPTEYQANRIGGGIHLDSLKNLLDAVDTMNLRNLEN